MLLGHVVIFFDPAHHSYYPTTITNAHIITFVSYQPSHTFPENDDRHYFLTPSGYLFLVAPYDFVDGTDRADWHKNNAHSDSVLLTGDTLTHQRRETEYTDRIMHTYQYTGANIGNSTQNLHDRILVAISLILLERYGRDVTIAYRRGGRTIYGARLPLRNSMSKYWIEKLRAIDDPAFATNHEMMNILTGYQQCVTERLSADMNREKLMTAQAQRKYDDLVKSMQSLLSE